ncbi:MAG TPA: ATP-binding cassette domain-containing protein [Albitalea sp.]
MDALGAVMSPVRPVVQAEGVLKRYGGATALCGVSLRLVRGEVYGLIGPDGAGKSSLLKAVAGVLSLEGGSLQVLGRAIASERDAANVQSRIGFMPQGLGLSLYPELSVQENIDFFADLRGVPARALAQRKARLLAATGLDPFQDRPAKQLSGGMKQKLALACTLVHEPELLVLDEPTTGIDPLSRRDFWSLLSALMRERAMTALIATAYLDEAERFDRIGLLYGGGLLAEGTPRGLQRSLPATMIEVAGADAPALERLRGTFAVDRHGSDALVLVATRDEDAALARVRAIVGDGPALRGRAPGLEDVFVARVREREPTRLSPVPPSARPARAGPQPGAAIEARRLTCDFGRFRAVENVSFSVVAGEIVGLLGANGAGKTTVLKMLTGIVPPTGGSGHVGGADMRRAPREVRRRIGYMSQAFSLYADLRVHENLLLYAGIYGLHGRAVHERVAEVVRLGGLALQLAQPAGALAVGLRQRLALGCALLHRPQVLFLDEPTAGVDPLGRREFWNILSWLARGEGVAILLSTHHMVEAELCDRLVLMHEGRVVADDTPQALKNAVRRPDASAASLEDAFMTLLTRSAR